MSSVGADKPVGAYLNIKKKTDDALLASGLPYVILRPSALVGEGRRMSNISLPVFWLGEIFSKRLALKYKPIDTVKMAEIIRYIVEDESIQNKIFDGQELLALQ